MANYVVVFIAGTYLGVVVGILTVCLCVAAKK